MSGDHYTLLGVRREATPAELRRAYEIAVRQASRDGAIKHVADLVRAYEVLSDPGRRWLYDGTGESVLPERIPNSHGRAVPWRGARPAVGQDGGRRWRSAPGGAFPPQPQKQFRLGRVLVVAAAFVGVLVAGLTVDLFATAPRPVSQPTHSSWPLVVPVTAHADSRGLVVVVCDGTPAGPRYLLKVRRGGSVWCTNGAVPRW